MRIGAIVQYNYIMAGSNLRKSVTFSSYQNLTPEQIEESIDLKVFKHHIYEYKKGIRHLILTTEKAKHKNTIEKRLEHEKIPFIINEVDGNVINVFFGDEPCVNVVKTFNQKLNKLSPEQDFMLGIMLGYDRVKQCSRYLKMKEKESKILV